MSTAQERREAARERCNVIRMKAEMSTDSFAQHIQSYGRALRPVYAPPVAHVNGPNNTLRAVRPVRALKVVIQLLDAFEPVPRHLIDKAKEDLANRTLTPDDARNLLALLPPAVSNKYLRRKLQWAANL